MLLLICINMHKTLFYTVYQDNAAPRFERTTQHIGVSGANRPPPILY